MTRPKRWFLVQDTDSAVVIKNTDGLIKKPNAARPLGKVVEVTKANAEKYKEDSIEFKCANGRIILSLKYHLWTNSLIRECLPIDEFFKELNQLLAATFVSGNNDQNEQTSVGASPRNSESRKRSRQVSILSPSKRCKHVKDTLDEEIERHKKGLFQVPISQLVQPPREARLLRETDQLFIKKLKEKMLMDPSAPGAAPMAVLCKDVSSSNFNEKHLNVYKYEVLGGLHSFQAKAELLKENPDNPFFGEALAEVYVELSDEQALRLAQRHNVNSHFVHRITHRELVEACRARLYRISKQDSSGETPIPTAEWRESCKRAIIPNDISATHRDAILHQASLPKAVWDVALDVMNAFEKLKLKDQRLKISSAVSKPEFKQQYLAPIRSLEPQEQIFLLLKCKNGEISLSELKKEANSLKQLAALKKNFVKLTNSNNWEDAVTRYPRFACESEMKKFIALDLSKGIPKSFLDFCKRAKSTADAGVTSSDSSVDHTFVQYGNIVDYALKHNPLELSGLVITNMFPAFQGADMIVVPIKLGCTTEEIESISYTAKEINTVAGLHTYAVIGICEPEAFLKVKAVWDSIFTFVDVLFFADDHLTKPSGSALKLDHCVSAVMLGFQSIDDNIKSTQFIYKEGEIKQNFFCGEHPELYEYLLDHFCCPSGTVLDMSCDPAGIMAVTAFKKEYNVVTIVNDDESCASVLGKLTKIASP